MKCAVALLAAALAAQTSVHRIAGTVVDSESGKPLAKVRVVLTPAGRQQTEVAAWTTGSNGAFDFEVVPGRYTLLVERTGFSTQRYVSSDVAIVAGPGLDTASIRFEWRTPGVIFGRVEDSGEPVENAQVHLLRAVVVQGTRRIVAAGSERTNDLGEFRFSDVAPGAYYVVAEGSPWYAQPARGDAANFAYAPVFYPSTLAGAVSVRAGQEVRADLSLTARRTAELTVKFAGPGAAGKSVHLTVALEGAESLPVGQWAADSRNAILRLTKIPPGSYRLRARQPGGISFEWTTPIELVAGANEITMNLATPPSASGVVTWPGAGEVAERSYAWLQPASGGVAMRVPVSAGTFSWSAIAPGAYFAGLTDAKGAYAAKVFRDGEAVPDKKIEFKAGDALKLSIAASRDTGRVKGVVERGGRPAAGVTVVLAPPGLGDPSRCYSLATDTDGTFDFAFAQPGEYRLAAISDPELEWADPQAGMPIFAAGKQVSVTAGEVVELRLLVP